MPGEPVVDQGEVSVQSPEEKEAYLEDVGRVSFECLADLQAGRFESISKYLEANRQIPSGELTAVLEATIAMHRFSVADPETPVEEIAVPETVMEEIAALDG